MTFEDKCNVDWLIEQISPYGNGKKLKTTRPKDDVAGYIWRMIQFHAGLNYHHPVTCFFRLFDQLKTEGIVSKKFYGIFDEEHTKILDKLEPIMIQCATKLNLSSTTAAMRMKGLLF